MADINAEQHCREVLLVISLADKPSLEACYRRAKSMPQASAQSIAPKAWLSQRVLRRPLTGSSLWATAAAACCAVP